MDYPVFRICMYCKKSLGVSDKIMSESEGLFTHGICDECYELEMDGIERDLVPWEEGKP